ncbi:hypothetical protein AGMMS4952_15950 [Spirochaetia bacterium]|nr:hypothetical protein AGMMS4952_15950 [Spirochaetia bacterium]
MFVKKLCILSGVLFLLTGCPPTEQTIEDTLYYLREVNDSSRNIYIQYYYTTISNDEPILERIHLNSHSAYNSGNSNYDHYYPGINYGEENNRWTSYGDPNKAIEKIIIVDTDSHRMLKKIENMNGVLTLENARDDYGMRCRFEDYVFTISNELFE